MKGGLADRERGASVSDLADRMGITRESVQRTMQRNADFPRAVRPGLWNWAEVRLWMIRYGRWDVATESPIRRSGRRKAAS